MNSRRITRAAWVAALTFVLAISPYNRAAAASTAQIGDPVSDTVQLWTAIADLFETAAHQLAIALERQQPGAVPQNESDAEPASVALTAELPALPAPTTIAPASRMTNTNTDQHVTKPVIARPAQTSANYITKDQFDAALSILANSLPRLISENTSKPTVSGPGAPLSVEAFAPSQQISQLNGVTITNANLTAAEIPDLSGTYLPLSGGTVTGNLTVNGSFSGGSLSLAIASTSNFVATNATSTSFFASTASSTNLFAQAASFGALATPALPNLSTSVENTEVPGLDGAHWFIWNDPGSFDPTPTLRVDRHADVGTGLSGHTYDAIWANASSGANNAGYEWAILGEMKNEALASNGAQNVAVNGTIYKEPNGIGSVGPSWGGNFNCTDETSENNPVASCIGAELDVFASTSSTDTNRQRVGLQIAAGGVAGAHIGYGILMGPSSGATIDRGISFQPGGGTYGIGLDTAASTFTTAPIFLGSGQKIVLDGNSSGAFNRSLYYQSGSLAYSTQNGVVTTIGDTGVVTGGGFVSSGTVGIGTASPQALLAISDNTSNANATAFLIASSTALATTTLLSVSNSGTVAINAGTNAGQNFTFSANVPLNYAQLLSNTSNLEIGSNVSGGSLLFTSNTGVVGAELTSGGNFGIGTTTPGAKLVVAGNAEEIYGSNPAYTLYSSGAGLTLWNLQVLDSNNDFRVLDGGTDYLHITQGGNVGIGSSTPTTNLSVTGNGYFTGGLGAGVENQAAGTLQTSGGAVIGGTLALNGTSGTTSIASGQGFTIGGSQFVLQQGSGKIGIGTTTPSDTLDVVGGDNVVQLTGSNPSFNLLSTSQANKWSLQVLDADDSLRLIQAGSERLRIAGASGNVGIGTTSPFASLSVVGNGYLTGALTAATVNAINGTTTNATSTNLFSTFGNFTTGLINMLSGTTLTYSAASTTNFSNFGTAYFGSIATSTFGNDGSLTLAGGLAGSTATFSGQLKESKSIGFSGPWSANLPGFYLSENAGGNGTTSGNLAPLNYIVVNSDTVNASSTSLVDGLNVSHSFGGVDPGTGMAATGGRTGIQATLTMTSPTGNNTAQTSGNYVGVQSNVTSSVNDNGSPSLPLGALFGFSSQTILNSGATNYLEATGGEINMSIHSGASVNYKALWTLVADPGDAVQGTTYDTMLALSNQTGAVGFQDGILFGPMNGMFPLTSSGTMIAATGTAAARNGIDFSSVTFSGDFLKSNGFTVDGNGAINASSTTYIGVTPVSPSTNGVSMIPNVSGQRATIRGYGIDATRGLNIEASGAGLVAIGNATDGHGFQVNDSGGLVANYIAVAGSTAGQPPSIAAGGTDTNIGVTYQTKGTGSHYFIGNVGIGSSTPAATLGLAGSQYLTGGLGIGLLNSASGTLLTSGTETIGGLSTLQSGFISQASSTVIGNLTSSGNGVFGGTLALNGSSGTTTIAAGQGFAIGGTKFVVQQGSGNIGIQNTSPSALFDIGGVSSVDSTQAGASNLYLRILANSGSNIGAGIGFSVSSIGSNVGAKIVFVRTGASSQGDLAFYTKPDTASGDDTTEKMRIMSNGNVGIGTTSPYSRLEVWGPDAASTTAVVVANSASTTEFSVYDTGNAVLAGSLTQNSDQRLKTNIQSLNASSSLSLIDALNPVTFNWIDPNKESIPQLGFVAQQVLPIFPNLISPTSPTALTPDGTLSLNYIDLRSPIVSAIQALSSEITSIENTVAGFANIFHTQELCVGSTCIDQQQLAAILATTNQSSADHSSGDSSSNATSSSNTPPIIQINGSNPAIIQVGATYNDLGATITGPQPDLNLDVQTFLNGSSMNPLQIDTSAPATDTIDYVVTDQNGLTSTSTRSVYVEAVASSSAAQ